MADGGWANGWAKRMSKGLGHLACALGMSVVEDSVSGNKYAYRHVGNARLLALFPGRRSKRLATAST